MIRAGVIGATGYAGAELVRILTQHPETQLTLLTSRQYQGTPFSDIYPSMSGVVDLTCESYSLDRTIAETEVVFTALPHKLPMDIVPELLTAGIKVIDLSADFRFKSVSSYEACYQPHSAPEWLKKSVYGLSEINFADLQQSELVGNPGCYPTSILLPLIPLLLAQRIHPDSIIADSKSGVSGAGRSLSLTTHFCEVYESFKAYKVAEHRHNPEINEVISQTIGREVHVTFVPHLVPMSRGMLSTIYADLTEQTTMDSIFSILEDYYSDHRFVRICRNRRLPETLRVRGTNYCDIGFRIDQRLNRIILISAIDNLVKGAAGQAVQNMNIMFGLDEALGLDDVPAPL